MLQGATRFHERFACESMNPPDSSSCTTVKTTWSAPSPPPNAPPLHPPSPPPALPTPPPPSPPPIVPVTTTSYYSFKNLVASCLQEDEVYGMCHSFVEGPMPLWDVSAVTTMRQAFEYKRSFRGDLSKWNTSLVTDMSFMFRDANVFD